MARRLAHFNDPKLEAQIQELIEASNALQVQINNLLDRVSDISFNVDGGRPGSEYGGYELIDGGGV